MTDREFEALETLWAYLRLEKPLQKADCIIGFGNYNMDIPARAAELYHAGFAPLVLFSGGLGRNTLGMLSKSEAESFKELALALGVPEEKILLENRSQNSAENLSFSKALLAERGIKVQKILGVHQPFMERRVRAAAGVVWPGIDFSVTSPLVDIPTFFDHAKRDGIDERRC